MSWVKACYPTTAKHLDFSGVGCAGSAKEPSTQNPGNKGNMGLWLAASGRKLMPLLLQLLLPLFLFFAAFTGDQRPLSAHGPPPPCQGGVTLHRLWGQQPLCSAAHPPASPLWWSSEPDHAVVPLLETPLWCSAPCHGLPGLPGVCSGCLVEELRCGSPGKAPVASASASEALRPHLGPSSRSD